MMSFLIKYKLLIVIVILASFLRLWQLGVVPPSPDWDEAALGWNAYSILKTGRDEYGTWFPLSLRSYDDYKPPLYVYLTVPSVAVFGLSVWSVRLPSVVMGVLAVIGTYFLAEELIGLTDDKEKTRLLKWMPLISSGLLAISPWHIQFSRIAFEANSGVTLNIWAVVLFLRGVRNQKKLWLSSLLFGLAFYAYHSERVFVPLLGLILLIVFRKEVFRTTKQAVLFFLIGFLTVAPLIPVTFNSTAMMRLQGTSSLADQTGLLKTSVSWLEFDQAHHDVIGQIFDNRRLIWAKTVISGYLSHYSFRWLFLTGDNARHHAPDMGLLYIWELPFLLWGMYAVSKKGGKLSAILWGWFFVAPVAASPTTELPHAIRTLVFLPSFQLFTAFGIVQFSSWIRERRKTIQNTLWAVVIIFAFLNFLYYLHMYFNHTNVEYSEFWQYGYKQAVTYASEHKSQYTKIVVSTKLEQPHMFFLFYLKYDPLTYIKNGGTASGGFAEVKNKFDIYEFRPIHWATERKDGRELYIGTPAEIPSGTLLDDIHYLDGSDAIRIADR